MSTALPLRMHGVTDVPSLENGAGPPRSAPQADEGLDWLGFLARFYPDARRHDYESLAAYLNYRKHLEHRP